MPNWCINLLEVQGPPSLVEAFMNNASGYNTAGRQPLKLQEEFGEGGEEGRAPLSLHQLEPEPQHVSYTEHVLPWRRACWGIKWDLGEDVRQERPEPGRVTYRFDTPWGPPLEALQRIVRRFPGLSWALRYVEQGNALYGNTGWQDGQQVFDQDFSQQGYMAFAEEIFGITHYAPGELPDEAYQLAEEIRSPPPAPSGLEEKQFQQLVAMSDSRTRRGQLRDWLADSQRPDRDLASAAVVMPRIDYWTAREMVEKFEQPDILRHAKGFTEGAQEYLQQWALEALTGKGPQDVQTSEQGTHLDILLQPRPLSMKERVERAHSLSQPSDKVADGPRWARKFQVGARLLRRLFQEDAAQLTPGQQEQLQERLQQWRKLDNQFGWGARRILGSLLLEDDTIAPSTLAGLLEDAPEESLYYTRVLEHPALPIENLQNGLSGLPRQHEYTHRRIAQRAVREQSLGLIMKMLSQHSISAGTLQVLFEGTQETKYLEKMTRAISKHRPQKTLELLEAISADTRHALQVEWLTPLLTQDKFHIREQAFKLLGRLGPEGEEWGLDKLKQQLPSRENPNTIEQNR